MVEGDTMEMQNVAEILSNTGVVVTFIIDHMEGVAGTLSFILSSFIFIKMLKTEKENAHEKRIEIYMDLSKQWDQIWAKITSYPAKNKDLFKKSIKEIDDENLRLAISNAVNLISRVFYYYSQTKQDIEKSDWHKTAKYIFSKPLFISIYQKHEQRYSESFKSYVLKIRNENKSNNVIDIKIGQEKSTQEVEKK